MTVETWLLEVLQQSNRKDVEAFARTLGMKPKGSKLDIIMGIKKDHIQGQRQIQEGL